VTTTRLILYSFISLAASVSRVGLDVIRGVDIMSLTRTFAGSNRRRLFSIPGLSWLLFLRPTFLNYDEGPIPFSPFTLRLLHIAREVYGLNISS